MVRPTFAYVIMILLFLGFAFAEARGEEYEPQLEVENAVVADLDPEPRDEEDLVWGDPLKPGGQYTIAAQLVNHSQEQVSYNLVIEVRYNLDITESIGWREASVGPGESTVVGLEWLPVDQGVYEIRMFAISDLVEPYPLSRMTVLTGVTVIPDSDFIPDVQLVVTDEGGNAREFNGLPGSYGYLISADTSIMIPKEKIEIEEGKDVLIGIGNTNTWSTKKVQVYYPLLIVGVDVISEREFDEWYSAILVETPRNPDAPNEWPFTGPNGYLDPVPTSTNQYRYLFDVPKGDYLLIAEVSYYYRVASTNVDEGSGWYFFRVVVT